MDTLTLILIIAASVWLLIVVLTTYFVGKSKKWSGGKIFGLIVLGLIFPPVWIIVIIVLASINNEEEPKFSEGEYHEAGENDRHAPSPPIQIPQTIGGTGRRKRIIEYNDGSQQTQLEDYNDYRDREYYRNLHKNY